MYCFQHSGDMPPQQTKNKFRKGGANFKISTDSKEKIIFELVNIDKGENNENRVI